MLPVCSCFCLGTTPVASVAPDAPVAPVALVAPAAPVASVALVAPVAHVARVAPVASVAHVAHPAVLVSAPIPAPSPAFPQFCCFVVVPPVAGTTPP